MNAVKTIALIAAVAWAAPTQSGTFIDIRGKMSAPSNHQSGKATDVPEAKQGARKGPPTGGRSRENIENIVLQNAASLRYVYNQRKRDKPGLTGKVTVEFAVNEFGKVIFAKAIESTTSDAEFDATVISCVRSFDFGKIDCPGDVTEVTYPFVFSE